MKKINISKQEEQMKGGIVANYLEKVAEDFDNIYVIAVGDNSFLRILVDNFDNPKFKRLKETSLLSATCFQSLAVANFVLEILSKSGVNTKRLQISRLSNYLKP